MIKLIGVLIVAVGFALRLIWLMSGNFFYFLIEACRNLRNEFLLLYVYCINHKLTRTIED